MYLHFDCDCGPEHQFLYLYRCAESEQVAQLSGYCSIPVIKSISVMSEMRQRLSPLPLTPIHLQARAKAVAKKRCFVISPIGQEGSEVRDHADDVFRFIIEPAMSEFDVCAVRSDHISETGRITEQMFREILQADLCIAVLTGLNPNVFYELAIAQSASRPVILLIEEGETLPFDVQDLRCVTYSRKSISRLVDGLYADRVKEQIKAIEESGWSAPSIYEEFDCAPRFQHEFQLYRFLRLAAVETLSPERSTNYLLKEGSSQQIVVLTGRLEDLLQEKQFNFDSVVSIEGTNLQLARFYQPSVSGILRYFDAEKSGGQVKHDSLQETINNQMRKHHLQPPLSAGSVMATPTTGLQEYNIKFVFHVAALEGTVGDGYTFRRSLLDDYVQEVFNHFEELAEPHQLKSIMFTIIDAEYVDVAPIEITSQLLPIVSRLMQRVSACRTVYLLARTRAELEAIHQAAQKADLLEHNPDPAETDQVAMLAVSPIEAP